MDLNFWYLLDGAKEGDDARARDIERLRQIRDLSQREGINTAGIRRIIELQELLLRLQAALGGR